RRAEYFFIRPGDGLAKAVLGNHVGGSFRRACGVKEPGHDRRVCKFYFKYEIIVSIPHVGKNHNESYDKFPIICAGISQLFWGMHPPGGLKKGEREASDPAVKSGFYPPPGCGQLGPLSAASSTRRRVSDKRTLMSLS